MGIYLYVGNLGRETTEDAVRKAFVAGGTPTKSVSILRSPQNDRSRGFGFVEFESEADAEAAIQKMNGVDLEGKPLKVSQARERARTRMDGRTFESYSGLGGRSPGGPRRSTGGARRKSR